MKRRKSRLTRKEETRSIRKAILYGGLTFILALGLVFLGIPILIKMAVFLGNLRSSSLPVETKDTLPPSPPVLKPSYKATNSAEIDIQGFAEPGSLVKIFLTGVSQKEIISSQDGSFSFANLRLTLGKNEIHTIAIDEAGNTSQESGKLTIFYDTTAPELEILEPPDGETFFGTKDKVDVKGKTGEETTVYINDHLVVVDREGNFQYPIALKEGENLIKVLALDEAGNETTKEITVNYSL